MQLDVVADEFGQQLADAVDCLVQAQAARLHHLLAAEGQQLPGQRGGAVGRALDFLDVLAAAIVHRQSIQQKIRIAEDRGEDVVEVVRDAAGKTADRLHLLRLAQLRLAQAERGFGGALTGEIADPRRERVLIDA